VNIGDLVEQYGYVAVLIGAFLEGESVALLGGFFALRGYLDLPLVMLAAFVGSMCGDQLAFWVGHRWVGREPPPRWRSLYDRAQRLLHDHRIKVLLTFRFFYGLRNAIPAAAGAMGIPASFFVWINVVGAAIWSVAVTFAGYSFGFALSRWLPRIERYEHWLAIGVVAMGMLGVLVHWLARWRRERRQSLASPPERSG